MSGTYTSDVSVARAGNIQSEAVTYCQVEEISRESPWSIAKQTSHVARSTVSPSTALLMTDGRWLALAKRDERNRRQVPESSDTDKRAEKSKLLRAITPCAEE
ncbi:hypothetical protein RRG08_034530 [Elysia crispata]|uniref:Uncharacterized protein n=1 Tax=Elysia crispata TaxID=231223 RepID=A0AAE1BA74_9GAST|nr:hypothetical protein RRG08_034530 [Elysia crispata]